MVTSRTLSLLEVLTNILVPGTRWIGATWRKTWTGFFGGDFHGTHRTAFEQHYKRIKRVVPKERLLVYDIRDGWDPLCRFLGHGVPATPFPCANSVATFTGRRRAAVRVVLWIVLGRIWGGFTRAVVVYWVVRAARRWLRETLRQVPFLYLS